ncbi:TlpA family protein disulfide reductase [Saprospira grandis]|uniref:TlpA family protein disulfide reductase n=1 Tax=Saprospira grandis TaxID=1008 RepID=UPI0022DE5541|nr:TlpA disulfide reductase family protein [Saprospira grandis]WBM74774.1 TlpA family protein disulfide reductase [Saprospira grandis]
MSKSWMFLLLLLAGSLSAQKKMSLEVELAADCELENLQLFQWTGTQVEPFSAMELTSSKSAKRYSYSGSLEEGNYYLGTSLNQMRPLYLGNEKKVILTGVCEDINAYEIKKSKTNQAFVAMLDSIREQSASFFALVSAYKQNVNEPKVLADLDKKLEALDYRRKSYLLALKKEQPELAKIVGLYTYLSYQNNKSSAEQREGDYLAQTYFQFTDLSDGTFKRIPFFYEAIKSYATNVSRVGLSAEEVQNYLDKTLDAVGQESPHHQSALLGVAFGLLSAQQKELFVQYAERYQKIHGGKSEVLDNFIQQQIIQVRGAAPIGGLAPDFEVATPEGKMLKLSDLRGKVLLVDFWASWCGPCRRENPNVRKVYEKYKDQGFEILGVSLDNNRDRWLKAIEKDGLDWYHVSDLKGWSSAPAKLYGVRGIPFTLLLDAEGRVLAKNLRGPALEAKLAELFEKK